MSVKAVHYAGALTIGPTEIIPGWAACCSGPKAEKIRAEKRNTYNPQEVTCSRCAAQILKGRGYKVPK